jgi:hypothetical protein
MEKHAWSLVLTEPPAEVRVDEVFGGSLRQTSSGA